MRSIAPLVAAYGRRFPRHLASPTGELAPTSGGISPVTFPTTPLQISVYIALGANLSANPSTWVWTDVTQYIRYSPSATSTDGRPDETKNSEVGTASLTLDNRDGRFSRKNPNSPYYGQLTRNTPIRITINAGNTTYTVAEQFVNEWPARWDKSASDFIVPIQCGGALRRLGQGNKPLKSVLYRSTIAAGPVAYWPLETGANAAFGGNAVAGGLTFTYTGTAPTRGSGGPAGSEPLWTFDTNTDAFGFVGSYTPTTSGWWGFQFVFNMANDPTLNPSISLMPIVEVRTTGTLNRWRLVLDKTTTPSDPFLFVEAADSTGAVFNIGSMPLSTMFPTGNKYGHDMIWGINVHQNGTEVDVDGAIFSPDDPSGAIWLFPVPGFFGSQTNGSVISVQIPTGYATRTSWVFGHISVWGKAFSLYSSQMNGYKGETALHRLTRLCSEQGVQFTSIGDAYDATEAMGPQPVASLLDILRQCESADGGVLCEMSFGLAYQTRYARYNAPYDMVVDYSTGQVDWLEPADDDQLLRNYITVSRDGGSSYVASDTTSIANEGFYDDSQTLNVYQDTQLQGAANWELHLGTQDDLRWPVIDLNFASDGGRQLIDQWVNLTCGKRILIKNVPDAVDAEDIDVFIEGKRQTFNNNEWKVSLNTSPGRVNNVARVHGSDPSNLERVGLHTVFPPVLQANLDTTTTSFTISGSGGLHTFQGLADTATYPESANFYIIMSGEVMLVTNVASATAPQTLTVVRSVNGIVKSHTAGESFTLYHPGTIGR